MPERETEPRRSKSPPREASRQDKNAGPGTQLPIARHVTKCKSVFITILAQRQGHPSSFSNRRAAAAPLFTVVPIAVVVAIVGIAALALIVAAAVIVSRTFCLELVDRLLQTANLVPKIRDHRHGMTHFLPAGSFKEEERVEGRG